MFLGEAARVLLAVIKAAGLWFLWIALWCWRQPERCPEAGESLRFACLIPARNEAAVIGALAASLRAQRYPAECFDIYVLANHCTDGTEAAAHAAGARVLRCGGWVRCKGDVLHEAVQRLPERYDAVCVLDADNVVQPQFLARMNDALCSGAAVAKSRIVTKNPRESWLSGCYALYYRLFELFFNRPRAALGLSAKLVGTGFAVRWEVLEALGGWNTETLAEDAEFSSLCACHGWRIAYVPEAVTYDEAPPRFSVSLTQRLRWCAGIMEAAQHTLPALLRAVGRRWRLRAVDQILFLCTPWFQVLSLVLLPLALFFSRDPVPPGAAAVLPAVYAASMSLFAAVLRRSLRPGDRPRWRSVVLFPLFMASWLPLQAAAALRRPRIWKPIPHGTTKPVQPLSYESSLKSAKKFFARIV